MTFKPWTFFAVALAGWMNRQQQDVIAYLRTENHILREKLACKRLILNDSQRRRLAATGMKLGKDLLRQFGTLFSPETILAWHRRLIARKYDGSDRRGKRGPVPTKANMIRKLVLRMAAENPTAIGKPSKTKLKPVESCTTIRRAFSLGSSNTAGWTGVGTSTVSYAV